MKATLFALFVALLMAGCGESSQPSESADMIDTAPESPNPSESVNTTDSAPEKDAIETAVDWSKLQDRNGVMYLLNEETPFTGKAESFYENGQKDWEGNFKQGKEHGLHIMWFENGQKKHETNYKDGEAEGLATWWYPNGQKRHETNIKDDKLMSAKSWKLNGEKCPETNVKDGDGVWIVYDEDGTVSGSGNFKDGESVD